MLLSFFLSIASFCGALFVLALLVTVTVDEKQKAKAWYRALGHVCAGTGFVMILSFAGALIAWVWQ